MPAPRSVGEVTDLPFSFALPGGGAPDPNDPRQLAQLLAQLQQLALTHGPGDASVLELGDVRGGLHLPAVGYRR